MNFEKILYLKNKGYYPDAILDIGAHTGNWTLSMKQIYDDVDYFLFEANDDINNIAKSYDRVKCYNAILNDKIDVVDWYKMYGSGYVCGSGDSFFKEKTKHYVNCIPIKKETIDLNTLINNENILTNSKNIFIKIDCQGAEIPILNGSTNILNKTDFILLEMPLFGVYNEGIPNFMEHINYMNSINFVPYDILEQHYINGFNMQIDMLFINKNHVFNKTVNELLLV